MAEPTLIRRNRALKNKCDRLLRVARAANELVTSVTTTGSGFLDDDALDMLFEALKEVEDLL